MRRYLRSGRDQIKNKSLLQSEGPYFMITRQQCLHLDNFQ